MWPDGRRAVDMEVEDTKRQVLIDGNLEIMGQNFPRNQKGLWLQTQLGKLTWDIRKGRK